MKSFIYYALAVLIVVTSSLPIYVVPAKAQAINEFSCAYVTEIPQIECEALVALYNSTNGAGWAWNTNWLVTNTPSNWSGVTVTSGHVTIINLSLFGHGNQLTGNIPPELGSLSNMKVLNLIGNHISGSIPSELGNLTNLEELYLVSNQLAGNLPPELGNLINLNSLYLNNNQFSGSLPPELGKLANLESLHLESNQLIGSIPPQLGNLSNLKILLLNNNRLTGSLPPELGNLTNLQSLTLEHNQLSGSIPPEMGKLTSLEYLFLYSNKLSENIPAEIGNLSNVVLLYLMNNQLSGSIPPELGNLSKMVVLGLENNQLSGSIPPELGNLFSGTIYQGSIDLSWNQLSGSIPPELGNTTNMSELVLSNNRLIGSIPVELGNLTNLTQLRLNNNQLSGSIPTELGNLTHLYKLYLQDNLLEGNIPQSFTNLVNLVDGGDSLDLDSNLLNVPSGYPDPGNPLQVFLHEKDPDWQLYQGFTQVIGSGGGELTSLDGRTDFLFLSGALNSDTTFTFVPQPVPDHSPGLLASAHNSFKLLGEDTGGNPVTTFNLPVTVTLTYTDADIFSIPEDTLGLYYWDESGSTWADAVTTCPGEYTRDPSGNKLALPLCHLTDFGLFGTPLRIFMPVVNH